MNIDELMTMFEPIAMRYGMKLRSTTRSESFDNAYSDYQYEDMTVRLIIDRSQPSVEVRPSSEVTPWRGVTELMDLMCEGPRFIERELSEILRFIDEKLHFVAVEYQRDAKQMDARVAKVSAEFVKHHFGW